MKNVIIAGSRNFDNFIFLMNCIDFLLEESEEVTIISGGARGADNLGEQYASMRGIEVMRMPAEWDKYGRSAGYIRNEEMAKVATHCVIFWDGVSRGSKHMMDLATKYKLTTRVYKWRNPPDTMVYPPN